MILIVNEQGHRLCKDGKWRSFACFGTYPECVKLYVYLGHAKRRAKQIGGLVAIIPDNKKDGSRRWSLDASGKVFEYDDSPDKPGYETVTHHNILDFAGNNALKWLSANCRKIFEIN